MRMLLHGKILIAVVAFLCLGWVLSACALPTNEGEAPPANLPLPPLPQGGEDDQGEGDDSSDGQVESPIEPQFGEDTLSCPVKDTTIYLGFDHALTSNYEDVSMTHFLHAGQLVLTAVDDQGTIESLGSTSIPYSMEGRMGDKCSLTGQGNMMASAHGTCENGVVTLVIEENWMAMTGEMTCVDEDGDSETMPFDAPAMGLQKHSGPGGQGEVFYLVAGSEGYSTMRPFAQGEGYHTWTLSAEGLPLVPLVP
jgi:hypothetical protein